MKIWLSIILTVCMTTVLSSQIINFPDANFKAKLLEAASGNGIAYLVDGPSFKIDSNNDGEIQESEALLVGGLFISFNSGISDLTGLEYFTNLENFRCNNNFITELDLSPLTNLEGFGVNNNNLTSLNISGLTNLFNFSCNDNQLTSLDLSGLTNLGVVHCDNNQITTLDLNVVPTLISVSCENNLLETLDVSNLSELNILDCSSNPNLRSLFIKNDSTEYLGLDFSDMDNLQYICADDVQLASVNEKIAAYGYTNCFVNSLCSFVDGEEFYTVSGTVLYDENSDGCDTNDATHPNLLVSFSDGIDEGNTFANASGAYQYPVQAGVYTITPMLSNTNYFTISPSESMVSFPEDGSSFIQDFCISPNGVFPDLEIFVEIVDFGFEYASTYKIIYKNKGTMTQSGVVAFSFDDAIMDFDSSEPTVSSQSTNLLEWDFTDLAPFEFREIEFILNFNGPNDTPPVMDGDIFTFEATITSNLTDETPEDNTFAFEQEFGCCLSTPTFTFSEYFSQYPNPTSEYIYLQMKQQIDVTSVTVFNVLGQEIKKVLFENNELKMDVSSFKAGHYFIKITTPQNEFFTRFIKK